MENPTRNRLLGKSGFLNGSQLPSFWSGPAPLRRLLHQILEAPQPAPQPPLHQQNFHRVSHRSSSQPLVPRQFVPFFRLAGNLRHLQWQSPRERSGNRLTSAATGSTPALRRTRWSRTPPSAWSSAAGSSAELIALQLRPLSLFWLRRQRHKNRFSNGLRRATALNPRSTSASTSSAVSTGASSAFPAQSLPTQFAPTHFRLNLSRNSSGRSKSHFFFTSAAICIHFRETSLNAATFYPIASCPPTLSARSVHSLFAARKKARPRPNSPSA